MKNLRYTNLTSPKQGRPGRVLCLRALTILCLMMASVGAWAADYVLTYTTGGTTYYLARNGTTGVTRVNTFNPTTCIWSCETAAGAAGTLNNSNTYGYLYQTVNGTKYYLYADVNAFSLKTDRATTNYSRMRTNGTYVYNRYSNTTSYYINLANNAPARNTTANTASNARPYQVTTNSVAVNNNGITAPTISCSGLSGSAGIQLSRTGVGGSYIPAHTTYAFNNQTLYYYNNTAYTNTNQFAVSVNANDATYNWSVTAGTANVSTTGVVTLGNNNTQNVTVRCRATINGVNKDATYTLNATATAALNETAYSDIEITPSSQTLDLGEEVTYTVSPSISQVTKTRPQYVTVTDAQGHTHYKVGTTYQAAEPTITETPGAAINFTSFSWSAAEGGAYFTLEPYYSASSNKATLTRSAQKTGTQQTFTISVTGVYGSQNKTATATVTIPATLVDLTALHAGEAVNLGVGSSESINGHYTYEPDYDSAGAPYLKFKYNSNNESVATVDASGKVTAVAPGSTTITITAVKLDGTDGVTCDVMVNVAIDAPTISIDGSGNVTITHPVPGVQIRYTTDGTDPTATTGTVYTASFAAGNEQTIKAIAVANGVASAVASEFYATSGVSGSKVILNDYMDHSWTLFQPQINGEENPIYYANPKDVKITYKANGGAVSISESADLFVYYKTLTDDYKYTTIPNPFSKRPRANGNYQGFSKWKITRISGGTITGLAVNSEVNAETELTFNPTNEYGMEVDFEVVWTRAYVVECAVGEVNGNLNSSTLAGDSYETNFIVITSGTNSTTNLTATTSKKVTITMVTPDGATDYRTGTRYIRPQTITLSNDWKFEYINMNNNGTTITANNHNLVLGRGISNTSATGVVAGTVQGVNAATNNNLNYHIRMESGRYTNVDATMQGNNTQFGGTQTIKMTVGCDYDRANNEDNTKLYITDRFYGGNSVYFTSAVNKSRETLRYTVKSGTIHTSTNMSTTVNGQFYFGIAGWTRYSGKRTLIIEGGNFHSISGGLDYDGNNGANDYAGIVTSQYANADDVMVEIQMRGGTVRGSIYGAAQFAAGKGIRKYVFTGGTINGWVAGGCNGTDTKGGQTYGSTQIYVGGNNHIIASNANPQINSSYGGNVFGAGSGIEGGTTVGQVNNSTLVVADQSIIGSNVFGGGNYGYVMTDNTANTGSTKIYVTGGTIRGKVFGGSNQQQGQRVNITMTGGIVEGGLYGGSNVTGTINQNVVMNIVGGQVGTSTTPANINGGGLGTPTRVTGNVDLTIGGTTSKQPLIYGSVYGGSESGYVNGTAYSNTKHTYVTMYNGDIHGSLYGGGNGAAGDANVYGNVLVTVNGGSVSEAVYGCNNSRGAPQGPVDVIINGTDPAPAEGQYALKNVFGGGNAANYTYTVNNKVYPTVTVNNCDNSIEYVYGGGNAATVPGTDVTIHGGNVIGNVFGGGYGANITTKGTKVTIDGGTILNVYGGSNSSGTITGGIAININEANETSCPINIDNVFGGGNRAASAAGSINIGCASHIGSVYGGANRANISGDINLSIVSGHIDNVFGGNNIEGDITGKITVTVNDNGSACGMLVGNVYGAGNQAAYSPTSTNYPVVNIQNGHLTGSVFGGGLGETAVVTGNPQVTIGQTSTGTVHIDGNVFGGGDAANVVGKPVVLVQNCSTQIGTKTDGVWNSTGGTVYGGGNAAHVTGSGNGTSVTINGGDINRVFGGGNGEVSPANVEGNAVTVIHAGNIHQAFAGSNMQGNISGSATITVDHDGTCDEKIDEVYGGGNKAAGNAGAVNIDCGAIVGDVYGGANQADINSAITLNITGGTINRVFGGNNTSGNISGAITVNVNKSNTCDLDLNYVYGAGNQASYTPSTPGAYPAVNILKGTVKQDVFGGGLGASAVVTSNPTVTVNGGTVSGNVFGGGSEANTVGTTSVTVQAGTVSTDVYGGGALADVEGNTTVAITGGTVTGNAYGGGLGRLEDAGAGITAVAAAVTGNTNVTVSGGTTNNVFGCNNFNGGPQGTVNVTISGGTVTNNVYGGGNLAAATANPTVTINGGTMLDIYGGGLGAAAVITGNTTIYINKTEDVMSVRNVFGGGSAANVAGNTAITMTEGTVSNIYGGGEAANVVVGADETGKTVVTMNGGTVSHSIYGGGLGNTTNVATSTTVTANGGTVTEDVYGGSGFGKVGATTVTINNGATVTRDVFGGGFGQNADAGAGKEAYEADVTGNASVTINKGAVINGNVYGGNNTNGSPKGTITVLVDGPQDAGEKAATPLNLKDVFGGGKNAATTSTGAPQVTIQGCETVIARVFGGGDAAPAPATDVTIWGGHITSAFAGGNGEVKAADIVGDVTITIKGGAITNVFGGSNTAGNIGGAVNVVVDKDPLACDLDVTNLFGGGNLAPGKGGTLTIACTGDGKIDNVYGGANQADVEGDVTLVINGGNIGNAFGGNNQSGTINGAIKVVIDWTGSTCGINKLNNVYGGGNLAPYTTPDGMVGPTVQLINATINNNVYGGGYGAPAKVTGDPIVTLEGATVTGNIFGGGDAAPVEGNPTVTATYGSAAKIFAGGKGSTAVVTGNPTAVLNKADDKTLTVTEIYGGGDAAEVTGNTTVTLTKGAVTNAFGGGNAAGINGTTTVDMTGGNVTTGLYGGCNSEGTVTGAIAVNVTGGKVGTDAEHKANVHGGGYGSNTQTAGNVAVAVNGAGVVVFGDIYGGSALGNVNDNTDDNTTVTITAGTVNGDVYGGGLGDASNAALVNGNVAVNINGGTVTGNVFGCNNVNGTPKGSVAVTVATDANANLAEVYGGGNEATYSPTTAQAPVVTILGCGNTIGYVYGGGNAADVPATDVTVWGGTIGNVFGGGHGDKDAVPATAANVTGDVTVNIKGGTITNVFAGSNSKGNIGGTVALTIDKDGDCEMHITDVYGGGNQAAGNAGQVTIGCTGGAGEGIQNVYGGANAADINSDIALVITGGTINNVFGGNNTSGTISGTIDVTVDWNGSCMTNHINNVYGAGNQAAYNGSPAVKIYNGEVSQNVFGGGLGATAIVTGNPVVTIGDAIVPAKVATVGGDVYGGGDAAAVVGTTQVNVIAKDNTTINNVYGGGNAANVNGTDVNIDGGHITGMVFGGGHGNAGSGIAADVNGNVAVDVTGGTINKVFGGSNDKGNISGTVAVNIHKEDASNEMHITEVYGGGNVAAGNAGQVTIGCTGGADEGIGTVYGGANNANVGNNIVLNISGGSIDNVFGGNNNGGAVAGSITVNVDWTGTCGTNKLGNVYGAGNIASYMGNPTVNITNCTTTGSVFGGGKGKPAVVVGNPTVNIGSWTAGEVHIGGNVFGGGDLAAVEGAPTVTIRDCNTYIGGDLYGGGNAAPVYETNTTVWGGTIAGNLFGGGNGVNLDPVTGNPKGAQVGYDHTDLANGGSGNANTYLYGGTIGTWSGSTCTSGGGVFGGSNSNGNIRGNVNLNVDERACGETGATKCPLKIKEIYGAGNEAAYVGSGIDFNLGCVSYLGEIYGGAKAADLDADAILTITSGHFGKVFGGNNISGKLNGKIVVTIDETGCNPVIIDELYGGGNQAAYSVYGYEDDGTPKTSGTAQADPVVNIISCTRIGTVFGGGLGETAVMVGNPTVNINQIKGVHAGTSPVGGEPIPDALGAIGTVFGGGNAAKVVGNTHVNVGTLTQNAHKQNAAGTIDVTPTAAGANITGNIYGGGNQANVTGKTNVTVGQ